MNHVYLSFGKCFFFRVLEMTQLQEMTEMSSQDDTRESSQYEVRHFSEGRLWL